jgi:large subunit ribosomal protein L15
MSLHTINKGITKHKRPKRIGRGTGSGHGKTSTRGHKGQGQCAGWSNSPMFEGGQTPLIRKIPKRGFHNAFADTVAIVNVGDLDKHFAAGDEVTIDKLQKLDLAKGVYDQLKVLGNGELTKKLKISAHRFSKSAIEKIQKAGGEVVELPKKAPVVKGQKRTKKKTATK